MTGRLTRGIDDIAMTGAAWITEAELAALVEIAKAAQEAANPTTPDGKAAPFMYLPSNDALRAALARLDNQ